jgi:hypothetical protein
MGAATSAPATGSGSTTGPAKHPRSQQQQIRYRKQRGGRTAKASRTMKVKKVKKVKKAKKNSRITDLSGSTMNKTRKNHS